MKQAASTLTAAGAGPGPDPVASPSPSPTSRAPDATPEARAAHAEYLVLGGILVLATILRLYGLGSWSFEQDELYTVRSALPLRFNVRPVYYVVVRMLLELLPPTEVVVRAPAFVFGVLGVGATWALGKRVFGTPAAHVAAILVALAPWHLYLSQIARYYSLVYLLSALAILLVLLSVDRDTPGVHLAALGVLVLGCLSHPSFTFPMVGVVLAVHLVTPGGALRWPLPSRRAWIWLWGPLLVGAVAAYLVLRPMGGVEALRTGDGRTLRGILLQLSAMVEATTPALVLLTVAGASFLVLAGPKRGDRRWGAVALLGGGSALALLVGLGFWTRVYADYAAAVLPLVFVTAGGFVQRIAEAMAVGRRAFAAAVPLILVAGLLPGVASHLSDGTRYDVRPAYARVVAAGGEHLVVAWPEILQRHYAPGVPFEPLQLDVEFLERTLETSAGFWLIGRYNRFGLMSDRGRVEPWIDARCRTVLYTERPRLDFRRYRVELHWCGAGNPPNPGLGGGAE